MPEQPYSRDAHDVYEPLATRPQMDVSYGIPSSHEGMLPWTWASAHLESANLYWLSTTRPDARPHTVPLWATWANGAVYFESGPQSRKGRNLAQNSAVSIGVEEHTEVVIVEGFAQEARDVDGQLAQQIADAFAAKYTYRPDSEAWRAGGLYRVAPRIVLGWAAFPSTATKWIFAAE